MKSLYLTFTSTEFRKLEKARSKTTYSNWRDFIFYRCTKGISVYRKPKRASARAIKENHEEEFMAGCL